MAVCTLRLYNSSKIEEGKNFKFDEMTDSSGELLPELGTKVYEEENFQYQRIELDKKIKVEIDQAAAIVRTINYAAITETVGTGQTKTFYYFVRNARQIAQKTVELTMRLDTLNTFAEGTDYTISSKTKIAREHKNRFRTPSYPAAGGTVYETFVDDADEGLGPMVQYLTSIRSLTDERMPVDALWKDQKWYIVYWSDTGAEDSAISVYILPERKESIKALNGGTWENVLSIEEIDRTKAQVLKIVECPYCPFNFSMPSFGHMTPISGYTFAQYDTLGKKAFKKTTFSVPFKSSRIAALTCNTTIRLYPNEVKDTADKIYDPKLYNSAFASYKLLYDSFSLEIKRENFYDYIEGSLRKFTVNYKQSDDFSSALLFEPSFLSDVKYDRDTDFLVLASNRMNEIPVFNSTYLNYMRTNYRYDEKLLANQLINQIISGSIAAIPAAVQLGTGIYTGSSSMVGSAISSIASSVAGIFTSHQQQKLILEAKKAELQAQATTVVGVGDLSLFNEYSGNKLSIAEYSVKGKLLDMLKDLFFKYGYATTRIGVPNHNRRMHFDFLQTDNAVVDSETIYDDFTEDIKERLNRGVTYWHYRPNAFGTTVKYGYDTDYAYENFEKGFYN